MRNINSQRLTAGSNLAPAKTPKPFQASSFWLLAPGSWLFCSTYVSPQILNQVQNNDENHE